jgi:hypothetical protein
MIEFKYQLSKLRIAYSLLLFTGWFGTALIHAEEAVSPDSADSVSIDSTHKAALDSAKSALSDSSDKDDLDSAKNAPLLSLAVMDFKASGLSGLEGQAIADRFVFELMETRKFAVMERCKMRIILQELQFSKMDCVAKSCAIEAGQLIAVQKIITGSISKVGGIYTLNLRMLDVRTGKIDMNISEDCDCPIEQVLTVTLKRMARKTAGLEVGEIKRAVEIKRGDASLFVKTDPEEASVYLDGKLMDGRTPITLENLVAGKHTVQVKKAGLRALQEVELKRNQVVRINLKLKKQKTMLKVMSNPSEAEVFINKKPSRKVRPDQITPGIFEDIRPGPLELNLFKIGYLDTSLKLEIEKNEINSISVELREAGIEIIKKQKKMCCQRKRRTLGRYVSLSSLAFLAGGGVFYYLAQKDYDEALEAKQLLKRSDINNGPDYDKELQRNQDKTDSGNLKSLFSAIGLGLGGAGLAVGLVFYF